MRASVRASSVLPEPVGPTSRTLDFSISTSGAVGLAALVTQAVVVVVDRDREDLLRAVLADDVLVQSARDLDRRGESLFSAGADVGLPALGRGLRLASLGGQARVAALLLLEDRVADLDALVADVHARRACDE